MRTATCAVFLILAFIAVQFADAKKIGGVGRMFKQAELNLTIPHLDSLGGVAALKKAVRNHPGYRRGPGRAEARSRSFATASESGSGGSGSEVEDPFDERNYYNPACAWNSTHGIGLQRLYEVCEKVDFDFMEKKFVSKAAAAKAWTKFCDTQCIGSVAGFFDTAYNPDCNHGGLEGLRGILGFCQKDAATDEYCGAQIVSSEAFREHPCERYQVQRNSTICATHEGCYWNFEERKCEEILTQSKIDGFCGNCMRQMVAVNNDLARYFDMACTKVEGHSCALEFQNFDRMFNNKNRTQSSGGSGSGSGGGDDDFLPTAQINHLCLANHSYRHTCLVATMAPIAGMMEEMAENSFESCWYNVEYYRQRANSSYQYYLSYNSSSSYQSWASYYLDQYHSNLRRADSKETECLRNYESTIKGGVSMVHMMTNLCQKNGDKYCYSYADLSNPDPRLICVFALEGAGGVCSSDCNTQLTGLATDMGCCAAALQTPKVHITAADFLPYVVNASKLGHGGSGGIDMTVLNACEGARAPLATGLAGSCSGNGSATSEYSIDLNINQTIFGANASWVAMLTPAALADIGAAIGLGVDGVFGFSVTANTQDSYTAKFTFQGPLQVVTDLMKNSLDSRLASRGIRTPHVDRLIRATCRSFCRTAAKTITATTPLTTLSPATPDPCMNEAYFSQVVVAYESCAGVADAVFDSDFTDLATANATWNTACNSQCNTALKELKANRFGICLTEESRFFTDTIGVGCTQDKLNYNRCGAVMSSIGSVHCRSLYNSTLCATAPNQCQWVANYSSCVEAPTAAYTGSICDGGCVGRLAAALSASNNKDLAKGISLFDQYFCSKDNGTLCLPYINAENTAIETQGLTNDVLVSVCETPKKRRCFKRIWSAVAEGELRDAEDNFLDCAEQVYENPTLPSYCYPSHEYYRYYSSSSACLTMGKCLARLAEDLEDSEKFDAMVSYMCVKNPKGTYCINAADPYLSSSASSENRFCIAQPLQGYSSSYGCGYDYSFRNCTRAYENFVADLGCCTGTAHFIHAHSCGFTDDSDLVPDASGFAKEEFGEDDLSDYSGSSLSFGSSSSDVSVPTTSTSGSLASSMASSSGLTEAQLEALQATAIAALNSSYALNPYIKTCGGLFDLFEFCPSKFPLSTMLTAQYGCVKPKVVGSNRTLTLGVAWNTINGNEKQKKRLLRKLKGDLSAKFGLAKDEFGAFELVEDADRSITVSSSSRRMATQSSSSGSKLNFQVATPSAEDNQATATEFDNTVEAGEMTLPSTTKAVSSECSNCTSSGSASSIQTATDTTGTVETGGDSSTSGASLATVAIAFVVAIMTMLF